MATSFYSSGANASEKALGAVCAGQSEGALGSVSASPNASAMSLVSTRPSESLSGAVCAGYAQGEARWYAAYTSAHHEKRVAEQLTQRGVENFLPVYESVRKWKDRRVRLQLPLFAGYVFVQLDLRERLRVLQVPGVATLVGFGGQPVPIPAEDLQAIRACLSGRHAVVPHPYVPCGQRVHIVSGPLAGLSGLVVRQRDATRFVISLELLQRSVAVEMEGAELSIM